MNKEEILKLRLQKVECEDAILALKKEQETRPAYFHDCPALGLHTRVPRALIASPDGEVVLAYQHKCPFCSYAADDKDLAPGVKQLPNGKYEVDMSIAERMSSTAQQGDKT